jgi:hypothetical protein
MWCWFVATVLWASWAGTSAAQQVEMKPIVVLSAASLDRLEDDIDFLGLTTQNDRLLEVLQDQLRLVTGIRELPGLDASRPWGAAIGTDGLVIEPVAFFPVDDARALLNALSPRLGPARPDDKGGLVIGQGSLTGYIKVTDRWAYLGQTAESLRWLPDPERVLGHWPNMAELAMEVHVQRIPEVLRSLAIDQVRLAARESARTVPAELTGAAALERQRQALQLAAIDAVLAQADRFTVAWKLDRRAKATLIEIEVIPIANTPMARSLAAMPAWSSRFSALAPESAPMSVGLRFDSLPADSAAGSFAWTVSRDLWAGRLAVLAGLGGASPEAAEAVNQAAQLAEAVIRPGQVDAACALLGDRPPYTLVAAGALPPGQNGRTLVDSLLSAVEAEAGADRLRRSVREVSGMPVHAVRLELGATQAELGQFLGPDLDLYVAGGDEAVYCAWGGDVDKVLKHAASLEPGAGRPLSATVRLGTLVMLAAPYVPDDRLKGLLPIIALNMKTVDDRVRMTTESIDGRLVIRLEGREGVLRLGALGLTLGTTPLFSRGL